MIGKGKNGLNDLIKTFRIPKFSFWRRFRNQLESPDCAGPQRHSVSALNADSNGERRRFLNENDIVSLSASSVKMQIKIDVNEMIFIPLGYSARQAKCVEKLFTNSIWRSAGARLLHGIPLAGARIKDIKLRRNCLNFFAQNIN